MNDNYTTTATIATNFVSVRQLTEDEAKKIYMKMKKEKLVEMLIASNKLVDSLYEQIGGAEKTIVYPNDNINLACSDWAHCTNPHMDCVNCPLRALPDSITISYSTQNE